MILNSLQVVIDELVAFLSNNKYNGLGVLFAWATYVLQFFVLNIN